MSGKTDLHLQTIKAWAAGVSFVCITCLHLKDHRFNFRRKTKAAAYFFSSLMQIHVMPNRDAQDSLYIQWGSKKFDCTHFVLTLCSINPITCLKLWEWNEPRGFLPEWFLQACHAAFNPFIDSLYTNWFSSSSRYNPLFLLK